MEVIEPRIVERAPRPVAVWSPHPLMPAHGRELCFDALLPGETLADYLERTGLAAAIGRHPVILAIDGYRVPRELWSRVRPRPGVIITVQAAVHGGRGKNPIATILSLAIMVANPAALLLGEAAGTSIIGSLTVGRVVNFGLGLIVNALFPPPSPQITAAQQANNVESPTYALTGGSNRARLWEPLPMICGTHRIGLDLGARTYTETEGDDSYLYQVFNAGFNAVTLSDWKIGTTPLSSFADWTMQESGTDGVLTLFPGNVDSIAGGTLEYGVYVQRTSSPGTTTLGVEIIGSAYALGDAGEIQGAAYAWTVEYRAVGSATWLPFVGASATVTGSGANRSRTPIRRTFKLDVSEGQYEVRVSSQTNPAAFDNPERYTFEFTWSQLRSYQPDAADYAGQHRVALKIRANGQLNGQVSELTAIGRARCEAWNGSSWVEAETDNPAWWYRAVAKGKFVTINGRSTRVWGGGLADARIDDASLKAWGAWCASKSLTFNAVFDRAMSVDDMLRAIATCGRASPSWATGKLGVVYDQGGLPVTAVLGMPSILAGSFSISYQNDNLADEIVVGFINPDLDWARDQVRCPVPGATSPTNSRTIELFGCTNLDMAGRAGMLYAAQQAYRRRTYTWRMDFEGMNIARGDVVQLSHDLASWDYSGRLVEGSSATVLKLDRKVSLEVGGGYVVIVWPDQSFTTHAVTGTGAGETDTLTLAAPLPSDPSADADHPVFDHKYLFGATATPGRLAKIAAFKPIDEKTVEVEAVDELDAFYLAEFEDYIYNPPRPTFNSPAIANLVITENGIRVGASYAVQLGVSWDVGADYGHAEVWASVNDGPETLRENTRGRSVQFQVADGDDVAIRVVAFSTLGRLGRTTILTTTHVVDFAASFPPADVSTFLINGAVLSWLPVADADVAGYRVRFNYGTNADWNAGTDLHRGLLTASPWEIPIRPLGPITLMIKAVDWSEQESASAAVLYADLTVAGDRVAVETFDLAAAGWPGTITNGAIDAGAVKASTSSRFWPADLAAGSFWPQDLNTGTFWPASVYEAMTYQASVTPSVVYAGGQLRVEATVAATRYAIEYRPRSSGRFWPSDLGGTFWPADLGSGTFWPASPDFQSWPGALAALEREPYDFRISTDGGPVQGVVSALTITVDAPVIEETLDDVAIAATTGSRLVLANSYHAISNVQTTVQADGAGAIAALVVDKDAALGPLVRMVNAAGGNPAGTVDVRVIGY